MKGIEKMKKINALMLALGLTASAVSAQDTLFSDDFKEDTGKWSFTSRNTIVANWKTAGGKTAVVLTNAGDTKKDTIFALSTKPFPLNGQKSYVLTFESASNFPPDNFNAPNKVWSNRIEFYDEAGKLLERKHFGYWNLKSGYRKATVKGQIPDSAKSMLIAFGGDAPNIDPGKFLAITNVALKAQ